MKCYICCRRTSFFPEDAGYERGKGPLVVGLGTKANTKAKRPQANSILEASSPVLVGILRDLKSITRPQNRMFPFTLEAYRKTLVAIQSESRLKMGWSPHSVRAGFASEAKAWGMSFEQIRETGRWKVDSSLQIYIDMLQAAQIAVGLKNAGWGPAFEWAAKHWAICALRSLDATERQRPLA